MKLSVHFPDDYSSSSGGSPTVKLKLPLVFPTHHHHHLPSAALSASSSTTITTFSLSTNFPSFPSFSISYSSPTPTSSPSPSPSHPSSLSLTLKSGVGFFGSPRDSPLLFSARFSLLGPPGTPTFSPVFSLRVKPNFGHFSLRRSTSSLPIPPADFPSSLQLREVNPHSVLGSDPVPQKATFVPKEGSFSDFLGKSIPDSAVIPHSVDKKLEEKEGFWSPKASVRSESRVGAGSSVWEEVMLEPPSEGGLTESMGAPRKSRSFSGFAVTTRTVLPVTRQVAVNVRWGVNLPSEMSRGMPYLSVSKLEIERIEDKNNSLITADLGGSAGDGFGDAEMLKGTWSWMRRDLESIRKENDQMKRCLEEIGRGAGKGCKVGAMSGTGKKDLKPASSGENEVDSDKWRSRRAREENRGKGNQVSSSIDLESQLRDAIMSASSS
ncbi:hypothetical protein MLD38_038956 [Melastoma candidum]|uniref:Uncharacterized protein n=1 Tax=Melastoma candidum TaxID=119954 RepID=A0ACB9L1B1_9MYRT|nr:hypothetical protein MLD38_038956 [Melastoma candidum]